MKFIIKIQSNLKLIGMEITVEMSNTENPVKLGKNPVLPRKSMEILEKPINKTIENHVKIL